MSETEYRDVLFDALFGAQGLFGDPLPPEEAKALASKLVAYSTGQRKFALASRDASSRLVVLHELLGIVKSSRQQEPLSTLELAQAAVDVAFGIQVQREQRCILSDFRAQALGELANAYRRCEDYRRADATWRRVDRILKHGNDDPILIAELDRLRAALKIDKQRPLEAITLLEHSLTLLVGLDRPDLESRALFELGYANLCAGQYSDARSHTISALRGAVDEENPRRCLNAFHNLVLAKAEAGDFEGAAALLLKIWPLYDLTNDPTLKLRAEWVAGRIGAHWREWRGAAERFEVVRQGLVERGLPYDAALVSLELAIAYLHQGRTARVKMLAREMYPVFIGQDIPREASAALLLFVEAAEREAATVKSVSSLLTKLKTRLAPKSRRGSQGRFVT